MNDTPPSFARAIARESFETDCIIADTIGIFNDNAGVSPFLNLTRGVFNICLNYGGRYEIVDMTKKLAGLVKVGKIDIESIDEDSHPYAYLRVNVTLAQFDKFNQTYGIKYGDGMYVPKNDRVKIW